MFSEVTVLVRMGGVVVVKGDTEVREILPMFFANFLNQRLWLYALASGL